MIKIKIQALFFEYFIYDELDY